MKRERKRYRLFENGQLVKETVPSELVIEIGWVQNAALQAERIQFGGRHLVLTRFNHAGRRLDVVHAGYTTARHTVRRNDNIRRESLLQQRIAHNRTRFTW